MLPDVLVYNKAITIKTAVIEWEKRKSTQFNGTELKLIKPTYTDNYLFATKDLRAHNGARTSFFTWGVYSGLKQAQKESPLTKHSARWNHWPCLQLLGPTKNSVK